MSIVVTGSVAFDYLMSFPGRFSDHILPDQIQHISLSILVDSMRKERGGCAPNIAYSLALLGERPTVMATVGRDFDEYRAWLEQAGVDTSVMVAIEDEFTASCFINTDRDNNQIVSFYSGAMRRADQLSFHDLDDVEIAIISPNAPAAMVKYARECQELGIPYIYDPSQQIVWLSGEELLAGSRGAKVLICNEYEFGMIKKKTGLSDEELLALPQATVITRGAEGSTIYADGQELSIPAVPPEPLAEPTGVGDAYRAGLIKGLRHGLPWETTGRIAALAAAYVLEQYGTQAHRYTRQEFVDRYTRTFGRTPQLEAIMLGTK
ncbi:MAG TPA: carbohydrate kinase family protein [Anaerolineae bacterium]|nr:carbohydrate kinase family protein [Anaerolineae bacterium]